MKNITCFLSVFFLLTAHLVSAQIYPNIPNQYFNVFEERPCPYDSTVAVTLPEHWELYQTTNGLWDGPRDSTLCLTGVIVDDDFQIELEQINPEYPLFLRYLFTEENKILLTKDWVYQLETYTTSSSYPIFETECSDSTFCTNAIAGIQIPDETGDSTAMRIHKFPAQSWWIGCIPTEYFEENYLRELILEYKVIDSLANGTSLEPHYIFMDPSWWIMPVEGLDIPAFTFNGSAYNTYLSDIAYNYGTNLVMHDPAVYPIGQNITYVEATPTDNPSEQRVINLFVGYDSSLEFQPFSSMRGSLVNGSDSLRHDLNIIFEEAEMCMAYIDVIFERNTKFIYSGGDIYFTSRNGCLMFHRGAALVIDDNTTFEYGQEGIGVLALGPGGTIEFGDNSTLVMNNRLVLSDFWQHPSNQVYVKLEKGASLIFGEHSQLTKQGLSAEEGHMKLNVYMNGGMLDDSNLSDKEKNLINRIYPEAAPEFADNVKMLGNPAVSDLEYSINLKEPSTIDWSIFDSNGKMMLQGNKNLEQGLHYETIDINRLARGIYYLEIKTQEGASSIKFVKV